MSLRKASRRGTYGSHFSRVEDVKLQRSVFDRSHTHKLTFGQSVPVDASWKPTTPDKAKAYMDRPAQLIPVYVDEVLPGDTFHMSTTAFVRMSTPVVPLMDNLYLDFFAFFVPSRLLWKNYEKFWGAQDDPGDSTDFLIPQIKVSGATNGASDPMFYGDPSNGFSQYRDLQDFFGIPCFNKSGSIQQISVNALPFRAYNFIWNYWFRDQNLQKSVVFNTEDGGDKETDFTLLPRGTRHDFFHSSLPWQQKGDQPILPIAGNAAVVSDPNNDNFVLSGATFSDKTGIYAQNSPDGSGVPNKMSRLWSEEASPLDHVALEDDIYESAPIEHLLGKVSQSGLVADMSGVSGVSISELRQLFQIQHFLERQARSGTRFKEVLQSHFRVTVPDERIDYPEFLGSGCVPLNQSMVAQTSSTDQTTPQGNLAAFSQSLGRFAWSKSFCEPGYVIVLAAPRADYTYSQGLNRLWSRQSLYDFYLPEFSHLSEQPIFNRELLVDADDSWNSGIFGFQEYGSRYRWNPNRSSGLFRQDVSDNLAVWHMGQVFSKDGSNGTIPATLSPAFIAETPPIGRYIAVPSQPHFLADLYFHLKCVRPMPVYSTPGWVDHF